MDVTGEGQRDRPALRVHRLSVVVCVLGFTIGPASGRLRARIARWGAAWALIWQLERTSASMIASSPARCPEVETTMGTHPLSSTVPNRTKRSPRWCVPGRWTGEDRQGAPEDHEKTGYRLPLDAGRLGAFPAEPSDGPVRQNIGQWARVTGSVRQASGRCRQLRNQESGVRMVTLPQALENWGCERGSEARIRRPLVSVRGCKVRLHGRLDLKSQQCRRPHCVTAGRDWLRPALRFDDVMLANPHH